MSDERDDLLKEIGDALNVEPSPAFAAGVRTRIANESGGRRGWMTWFIWGGAASAAAAVAVLAMSRPVTRVTLPPAATPVVVQAETPVAATKRPAVIQNEPARAARLAGMRTLSSAGASVSAGADEPLVQIDKRTSLDRIWQTALRISVAAVEPPATMPVPVEISAILPLPELKELAVAPLVVAAIETSTSTPGGGSGVRRLVEGAQR